MRLLTDNTGKGQLEILSVLAEEAGLTRTEITERSSLSKGSVSNNVSKLKERDLLEEEDGELEIAFSKLLEHYREHLEGFLIRRSEEPEEMNEVRTLTKQKVSEILDEQGGALTDIIKDVLENARERSDLESLNSVFKEVDRILSDNATNPQLELIGLATDLSTSTTGIETRNLEEAKRILDEVESNNG